MPDYYFDRLSPYDFENLVRDLLQADWGLRLENFTAGRDGGIDLRHAAGPSRLVVQCKHYPHSDWSSLKRALLAEVPKVTQINPSRYVVATSMGLSPDRKNIIVQQFAPYCTGPSDVFGREDLNNLLGLHPKVERQHHKLWLTSVPILSRVLHSGIFSEQQAELEAIARRVSRFVRSSSFPRALQALKDQHFVMITGVPGIGKSTLAEMLLIEHISRGFQCFRIWEGVDEARAVLERDELQLFYFDDFLGRTGLKHQVVRNEDERLIRFIREVSHSPKTRLILTTREYILNQAREFMEALDSEEIELGRCVVDLGDYSPKIRAEILYNHLYFSELPREHLASLLESKTYRLIVRHKNYSPRILETMTDALNVRSLPASEYPSRFSAALDNPTRLWEVAYHHHLSTAAQDALLVIATLPDRVRLLDAELAFEAFHTSRGSRYGFARTAYDWERALKELEGNFVKSELSHGELIIEFHNPSVRDFLESHLTQHSRDIDDLMSASIFASQVARLWQILRRAGKEMQAEQIAEIAAQYWSLRDSESPSIYVVHYYGSSPRWTANRESLLLRFLVLWDIALSSSLPCRPVLDTACQDALNVVLTGAIDRREIVPILERFQGSPVATLGRDHPLYRAALERAFSFKEFVEVGEFSVLATFVDDHADVIPAEYKERLIVAFAQASLEEEQQIRSEMDFDTQLSWFEDLKVVADKLGVQLELTREELEEGQEETGGYDDEDDSSYSRVGTREYISDSALDSLFDSLRDVSRPM